MLEDLLACALIAAVASVVMLSSRLHAPLGADEGYLWYGLQQLLGGRMPHRDFKSYEPGRYWWLGMFARGFGPGLRVLRYGTHAFFALCLAATLFSLRKLGLAWPIVACTGIALTALSHPQHKQFEHGAVLLAFATLQWAWAWPSPWSMASAAATVGLASLMGFNLLLYFAAALLVTVTASAWVGRPGVDATTFIALAAGGAAGLLPFCLLLLSPGFARNFHQRRIGSVLARGESNLSLPRPWPWRCAPLQLQGLDRAHRVALQWIFLALFVVPLVAIAAAVAWPVSHGSLLPAATLGVFLAHHAASRADPPHITQSLAPVCLIALLWSARVPWAAAGIAAASIWLTWPLQPRVQLRRSEGAVLRRDTDGLEVGFGGAEARLFDAATTLRAGNSGKHPWLFAAPAFPALYAWLAVDAPVYDTFALHPSAAHTQADMVDGIERCAVTAAIVSNAAIDGRDDLRFEHTHAIVWSHLHASFHAMARPDLGPDVMVFTRPALSGMDAVQRSKA